MLAPIRFLLVDTRPAAASSAGLPQLTYSVLAHGVLTHGTAARRGGGAYAAEFGLADLGAHLLAVFLDGQQVAVLISPALRSLHITH